MNREKESAAVNHVLLVDDDPLNIDVLQSALEAVGIEATDAVDGEDALSHLSFDFPGVLVTDVKMPRMDGIELLARVREIDPDMPVLLVTGFGDVGMAVDEARHDGAESGDR